MKFLLFGSGEEGAMISYVLGRNNIAFFCDNNKSICGNSKYGIRVIDFDIFLNIYSNYIVGITANVENVMHISEQLEVNGIVDYVIFDYDIVYKIKKGQIKDLSNFFSEKKNRLLCKAEYFRKVSMQKDKQLKYLIKELKPINMMHAKGYLRRKQLELLDFYKEFEHEISDLGINLFTIGGCLIGEKRNGGYVPWDDDLDFGIIRKDYNQLFDYARKNWKIFEREGIQSEDYDWYNHILTENPDQILFIIAPTCTMITKGNSIVEYNEFQLFIFDCFDDNYLYEEYKKEVCRIREKKRDKYNDRDMLEIERKAVKENIHIVENGLKLGFGFDNIMAYDHMFVNNWLDYNVVFPTRLMKFEHIMLPFANDIDAYLSYAFPNYQSFPNDVGIEKITYKVNMSKKDIMPSVEFYIGQPQHIIFFESVYKYLRQMGIYAYYVIEEDYCNTYDISDAKQVESMLIEKMLEYKKYLWPNAIAVAVGDYSLLRRYSSGGKVVCSGFETYESIISEIMELIKK